MKLHPLLTDRTAINILKTLYNHEVIEKNSYTIKLSEAGKKACCSSYPLESAQKLSSYGLIALDAVEKDHVMSMTNKGKEFIEIFDQLVELFQPKRTGERSVRIKYELTNQEKRILVLAYKISKESGSEMVPLKMLVQELYPYDQAGKASVVSRYISKLEELSLMQRSKEGRNVLVSVTEQGFRTIREQYLKGLIH